MVNLNDIFGDISSVVNERLFSDFLLPFVLVFAVIFAILQTTKILGAKKNIDAVVAIVFGLLLVRNQKIVDFISNFLPNISVALLAILAVLLIGGLIIGKEMKFGKNFKAWAIVFAIVLVVWIFRSDFFGASGFLSPQTKGIIAFVLIIVALIGFLGGEEETEKGEGGLKEFIFGKED